MPETDPREKEEQTTAKRAQMLNRPYMDARQIAKLDPNMKLITAEDMARYRVVPLGTSAYKAQFGFTERTKRSALEAVKQKLPQLNLELVFISDTSFMEIFDFYWRTQHPEDPDAFKRLSEKQQIAQVNQKDLFSTIAQQAYQRGASDIHIEPGETDVSIRYRIDGVLQPVASMAFDKYQILLTDIQTRGGIKWNAGFAQTGRISEVLEGSKGQPIKVDMRLETIPTLHGTDIVVRIFNIEVAYLELDNIGLAAKQKTVIEKLISHPHGMVLMVGPTGSGKTSTQYAIINRLNKSDVKIITLEDPVEYELKGVAQIPVYSIEGESFADKFRSVLREDPDIVMIGEIRDADTAKTALQAALTGHLVLSTFHASSAAAAVSRLMDMIGQNPLVGSSVRLIMAQRLLRKLCEQCKKVYTPSQEELEKVKKTLQNLPPGEEVDLTNMQFYRARGCKKCNNIGYKGRIMVAEQLTMTPAMEQLISHGTAETTADRIEQQAKKDGMLTILQDALIKASRGITSLEEVYRVLEE